MIEMSHHLALATKVANGCSGQSMASRLREVIPSTQS